MELFRLLDVCRLCLKQSSNKFDIFSDKNVEDKLTKVFKFTVAHNAQLSPLICLTCYELILRFHDYSDTIYKNQTYLDTLLCKHKIPQTGIEDNSNEDDIQIQKEETHVAAVEHAQDDDAHEETSLEPIKPPPRRTKGDDLINEYMTLLCDICDQSDPAMFDNFKHLQEHFQQSHNVTGYAVCCGRKFTRKDRLITHITNHIDPNAFKCKVCDHASKSRSLLRIHMKQHLGSAERRFACGKCEQKFVLRSQLVNHEASHLENSEKKHVCDICGKAFALKFVLMKHKHLHTGAAKEFVCEICAKSISSKASLKAHMDSHCDEGQLRVQCDVCSRWYKNAETLRTHVRVWHKDQQTHRCDHCGKIFPSKSSLTAHIKYVHVREAKFGCEQCDKHFRKKVELKEHMARVHNGTSLYQCEFCKKTFSCSSNYFSHRKTKHPKEYARQTVDRCTST